MPMTIWKRFANAIRRWYEGELLPPDDSVPFRCLLRYNQHLSSRIARIFVEFYLKEWKWLLPFLVGLIGAIAAIAKLS